MIFAQSSRLSVDKWSVNKDKIDLEAKKIKGISQSVIDWDGQSTNQLLDFNYWKEQRGQKDNQPNWKTKLRDSRLLEPVGNVIQCVNICKVFRGVNSHFAQYLSKIYEGDEIQTMEDSYTWVLLVDGTLLRLSPKSSITFNEINVSKKKVFHNYRLNFGHLHWQHRQIGRYETQNLAETDQAFLPVLIKKANREYYQRQKFQQLDDYGKMNFEISEYPGHIEQYEKLNELLQENKEAVLAKESEILISTANTTISAKNSIFDLFYEVSGNAYFRQLENVDGIENVENASVPMKVYFRGYSNRTKQEVEFNKWYEMQKNGREVKESTSAKSSFAILDLLIKRIPSIHLAREIMLRKYFEFYFWMPQDITSEKLALNFSLRLWDEDSADETTLRKKFLKEYIRRTETTNLSSLKRFYEGKKIFGFDTSYTQNAFNAYLTYLKFRKTDHYRQVKEMTDVQYYAWILRYGQKSISSYFR